MEIVGNYILNLKFGGTIVSVVPQMIKEMTITQDVDRLVPTFRICVRDTTGILGEIVPLDKNLNNVELEIVRGDNSDNLNNFKFVVKRRRITSSKDYEIVGVLSIDNLLSTVKDRVLIGSIKTNLEDIVNTELNISDTEIGISLDYEKDILQPGWTNAKLFSYLKDRFIGKSGEAGYHCFVKNIRGKPIFVFKSIDEILSTAVRYKFVVGYKEYQEEDYYPVSEYKIFDNSQIMVDFGGKNQSYSYFNYDTGEYINNSIDILDCPSLAENFLIDDDNYNDTGSIRGMNLGRSNDFTPDFNGKIRNSYYKRLNNLIHMWISTWGLENVSPGDIVKVVFSEAFNRGNLFIYQHSGYWMVKRVVHIIGSSFMTNLLLVRCGIDTDLETTLMKATNIKRKW